MKNLLLIRCTDQVGLVALIARILANYQLNITAMREFVDENLAAFFTRIECQGEISDKTALQTELQFNLPKEAFISINPKQEKRVAVFVTREFHCLGDILTKNSFNTLNANICCVIGNHDLLEDFTTKFSIPFYCISHENKSKMDFENEMLAVLDAYNPDYIILAKFMRILSPDFIEKYSQRIINIHHSFLPAFSGANPYRQAFERGVKLIGATAHFVTNELDEGPVICQQTIAVNHTFSIKDMVTAGIEIEKYVLNRALQLVLQDRVFISGNKTIIFE